MFGLAVLLLSVTAGGPREAAESIRPEAVEAHLRFLADDLLEGRATGSRGYDLAALYVASTFQSMGLEPAGDGGSYFQQVPLREARLRSEANRLVLIGGDGREILAPDEHYVLQESFLSGEETISAPLAFVGFGVTAPELDHDDYRDIDVAGKIVVLFSGAPARFPSDQRAFYSSARLKAETAAANGAVGIVRILTPTDEARMPWPSVVQHARFGGMRWLDGSGRPSGVSSGMRGSAVLSRKGAEILFRHSPHSLEDLFSATEQGSPPVFDLPLRAEIRTASEHRDIRSPNVVALLPGSDPALRDEFLVYTAHLDHVGVGTPIDGDGIYNGAYDNASGVAVLLEIARAFARLEPAPKRSVLFAALTAEEKGLLGSDYLVHHPPIPSGSLVANVNIDGVLMLHSLEDVVPFGADHSSLDSLVRETASQMDVEVASDFMPEEVVFIRSDQYSFVRAGIPAVYLFVGLETGKEALDGASQFWEWMATRYHTPKDDLSQKMDFQAGAHYARLNFLLGHRIANDPRKPRWKPGDFFGEKFRRR